ncbi:MAG: hypothetical protein V1820_00635 [archaeon]
MPNMLVCPICGDEIMPELEGNDGEVLTCDNCGADLVVRDKKAFKSLDLVGLKELSDGNNEDSGFGGRMSFI